MSFLDKPPRSAWPRGQKFALTPKGSEVEVAYRATIAAARTEAGRRDSFDAARAGWASTHQLQPDDGLYLAEVRGGPANLKQIVDALLGCDKDRRDAIAALQRLVDGGFVALHVEPPPAA